VHGTWKVTGYGLLGSLASLGFIAAGAAAGFEAAVWLLARIVWVLGTLAVVVALAAAVIVTLFRLADRRDARRMEVWRMQRADAAQPIPSAPPPELGAAQTCSCGARPDLAQPAGRAALGFRDLHIHLHGTADEGQAEVIRRALGSS